MDEPTLEAVAVEAVLGRLSRVSWELRWRSPA